jgi:hypothetical protein
MTASTTAGKGIQTNKENKSEIRETVAAVAHTGVGESTSSNSHLQTAEKKKVKYSHEMWTWRRR